jgi:hypothetical protein
LGTRSYKNLATFCWLGAGRRRDLKVNLRLLMLTAHEEMALKDESTDLSETGY